eukprot:COSAG02_NODE_3604_length_6492_cov_3.323166_3_plen_212_part_00
MILAKLRFKIQNHVNPNQDFSTVTMKMFQQHFNLDPDGLLRPQNLAAGLKNLEIPIDDGDTSRMMQVLDHDNDEKLSQDEFMSAIIHGRVSRVSSVPASPGASGPVQVPVQVAPIMHNTPGGTPGGIPATTPGSEVPPTPGSGAMSIEPRPDVPASQYHPRALVISPDNVQLANIVFDLLDTNSDGRLDGTDLIVSTSYNMTDMEKEFHGI